MVVKRSNNYRNTYFKNNKHKKIRKNKEYYRCVYCGKTFPREIITIDHIIPINKAKKSFLVRMYLRLIGIHNINNKRNLVACCEKCNKKKGTKIGLYPIRAVLGKHTIYWIIRRLIQITILVIVICFLYHIYINLGFESLDITTYIKR